MTKNNPKLFIPGAETFKREVSHLYFDKIHKAYRTLNEENIISDEIYKFIEDEARNGGIKEDKLIRLFKKELHLQHADILKIISALKERLMDDGDENDAVNAKQKHVDLLLAAAEEENK